MNNKPALRGQIRHALLLFMLLLFPVIMNYMSPYVIIDRAFQGVMSGSCVEG